MGWRRGEAGFFGGAGPRLTPSGPSIGPEKSAGSESGVPPPPPIGARTRPPPPGLPHRAATDSRDGRSGAVVTRRRPSPRESAPTPERVHRPPPPSLRTFSRHSTTSFVRRVSPFSRRTARNRSGCRVNRYRFRALFSRVLSAATAADTSESPRELSSLVYFLFALCIIFPPRVRYAKNITVRKKNKSYEFLFFFCDRLFNFFRFLTGKSLCRVSVKKKLKSNHRHGRTVHTGRQSLRQPNPSTVADRIFAQRTVDVAQMDRMDSRTW